MKNEAETEDLSGGSAMIKLIERASIDPGVGVDTMERLLAMQVKVLDKQALNDFNAAMMMVQKEANNVVKNAENKHTRSRYANLESVNRVIKPVYTKHGFALSFGTAESHLAEHTRITCRISHIGGHIEDRFYDCPLDISGIGGKVTKTAMHASGSTMSYGRRYLIVLIFNITIADEDDDGCYKALDFINAEQMSVIQNLIEETGTDNDKFLNYLSKKGIDGLPMITTNSYDAIRMLLEAKK